MIVDAHVHVLPERVRRDVAEVRAADRWFDACHAPAGARVIGVEDLLHAMDASGVDAAVCFTWPFADPALCAEGNDYLAEAQRRHPGRIVGFGCVNPAAPGAADEVRRCASLGLRGLGELNADAQGWTLDDELAVAPVAAAAVAAGMPVTVHASEPVGHDYPGKGTATPDRLVRLAERHPDLTVIGAHLGGGLPFYAHMPEVRRLIRANLRFDTAAAPYLYEPGAYRTVIELCGADRLLLGSDHPLLGVDRYRRDLEGLGLPHDDVAAVMGGNAASILGL